MIFSREYVNYLARHVFKAAPWEAFHEVKSKRNWTYAPSTFEGDTFMDLEQYVAQLAAACADDPELLRAWTSGDWSVVRGAYFASCIDEGGKEQSDSIARGTRYRMARRANRQLAAQVIANEFYRNQEPMRRIAIGGCEVPNWQFFHSRVTKIS
jgi:hypothetical protein